MFHNARIAQVHATLYSAQCYNLASRRVFRDRQIAQLWQRMGDIMKAAAFHYDRRAIEAEWEETMIAEWETVNSWENMPCGDE